MPEKPSQTQIKLESIFENEEDFDQISTQPKRITDLIDSEEFITTGSTRPTILTRVKDRFDTLMGFYCAVSILKFAAYTINIIQPFICYLTF